MESITLSHGCFDELHIQSTPTRAFTTSLDTWTSSTKLLAKFQNNLSAGNINLNGLIVDQLKIKRRKLGELTWQDVTALEFYDSTPTYQYIDCLVEAAETYEYASVPSTSSVEGTYSTGQVDVDFDGGFIFDKDTKFHALYNFEIGDVNFNQPNSTVELLGSKYPIVMYAATTSYISGSVKCMVVSDSSALECEIDPAAEKAKRLALMAFMTNKRPKMVKDASGYFMLINVVGTPKLEPIMMLNAYIYNIEFDYVEIGDPYDTTTLQNNAIID
jgi:hypothetical protein